MVKRKENRDLRVSNTFGLKVNAALYIEYDDPMDLARLDWTSLPQPVLSVGAGSNLLFTKDFAGTILHSAIKDIQVLEDRSDADYTYVYAGSGVVFDDLCKWAAVRELWGIENLSGIPGTVGASAVQNVGAYGVEAGDVIDTVRCYDIQQGAFVDFKNADCAFAYRDSMFKHNRGRYIVVGVVFRLTSLFEPQLEYGHLREAVERNMEFFRADANPYMTVLGNHMTVGLPQMPLSPMLVRDTVRIIRDEKLPDPAKVGSAGSFFKNPVVSREVYDAVVEAVAKAKGMAADEVKVPHYDLEDGSVKIPAAFLIELCGFKGMAHGGAAVWDKQPLVLVNASGKATAAEILELENMIIDKIRNVFGITLSPEVDHI